MSVKAKLLTSFTVRENSLTFFLLLQIGIVWVLDHKNS